MRIQPKKLVSSALCALAVGSALGCGSGSARNEIVARIAGVGSITKAAIDHWTRVEFILRNELVPTHPVPKGVIPDPPTYSDCISYLKHKAQVEHASAQSSATLAIDCRRSEEKVRADMLEKLILWYWSIGRADVLGIGASKTETRQRLSEVIKSHGLYGSNLAQYLKLSEQTMADLRFRSRVQSSEQRLTSREKRLFSTIPKGLTAEQQQSAYLAIARKSLAITGWVAKTSCRKGYVIPVCKQYTGPEAPPLGGA